MSSVSNIPTSMFKFDLLFLGETSTDIAWRLIRHRGRLLCQIPCMWGNNCKNRMENRSDGM